MIIDLENLNGLPDKFIERLKMFDNIFIQNDFLENFENNNKIHQLIIDIDNYCLENKIIGYHYTNAIETDILKKGMILRTGKEIRKIFEESHFHLFTKKEQNQIRIAWKKQFDKSDKKYRDNRIFFNFTKNALQNGGAELLLNYFGGEQIYFPIYGLPQFGEKLKQIGTPMILKCILNPNDINTFIEYPWGKITVSSYHRIKNPEAHVVDQDGYQKVNVKAANIKILVNIQV